MVDGFEYYYFFPVWVFQRYIGVRKSKNVRKSRKKQMKPRGLDNWHQIWALSLQVLKPHCSDKVELPLCKVVKWSWLSHFLVSDTFLSFPPLFPSPVNAHHSHFPSPRDPRTSTKIGKTTVCVVPAGGCPMPGSGCVGGPTPKIMELGSGRKGGHPTPSLVRKHASLCWPGVKPPS